jgi:O-antigen ligase
MHTLTAPASRYPSAYILSLFAAILALPLFEAPKTVFLLLFFVFAAFNVWKNRSAVNWGGDDLLLCCWMISGYVVAFFAGIHYKEWGGAHGPLLLALLLFFLKRVELNKTVTRRLLIAILLSTLIANIEGFWQFFTGQHTALELKSVGHVNHSAIYLCLNFGLALAMTLTIKRSDPLSVKLFIACCLLLTAASIIISNSRATIVTMGIIALISGLLWMKRSRLPLLFLLLGLAVTAGGLYFGNARVVQKHQQQTSHGPFLGERAPIWNSALLAWRHNPVFGLGIKNYGQADAVLQEQWLAQEGRHYDGKEFLAYAHAHSFYLTTLAEQGLFGLAITLSVLLRVAWLLYRRRPQASDSGDYWVVWLAAIGALQVVLVNGMFNTTLHHEHGLLSMLLIGLWWAGITSIQQR